MKAKAWFFFSYIILLLLSSCNDSLTFLPPDGQVKDEYWKKKEDVLATLMGAYLKMAQMDTYLFYYGELRGDLLAPDVSLSNEFRSIMESNIYPTNSISDWKSFYSIINYCNLVLKYSPQVKQLDNTFTDYKYDSYNAEAIFIRSLSYFYLVRVFKDVPFLLFPYDSDKQNLFPHKTSDNVILDSLEIQLNRILPLIPEGHETNDITRGRATRGAVNALLADIALWKFDYEACINYVENIERSELYALVPGGQWFTIFSDGNTMEGIFELQFDTELGQENGMYDITFSQNRRYLASSFIMELLNSQSGVRGRGSVTRNRLIWKYVGQLPDEIALRPENKRRSGNWIVYRLADVKLMKAEALSQLGRYLEALEIIHEIQDRAFSPLTTTYQLSPQAFEDLILTERAKELAFEGKRWFDLMRMGRRNNFERKGKLVEIIVENVPATRKRVLASKLNDSNGWYLPIYQREIENNVNMEQNPYY